MARLASGGLTGVVSGALFAAACAGSAPAASEAPSSSAAAGAWQGGKATGAPQGSALAEGSQPKCPYGELTDPHRGFVRCLTPDERDAGWLPPTAQTPPAPPAPTPSVEPDAGSPAASGPPPAVEIGSPAFENGQVPRTEKALAKLEGAIGKCVADHGGLSGATGSMKVAFLVRVRGRAEGVEVQSAKNVTAEAKDCVRVLLKNKAIGAPSADPVGVTVTLTFKPR
jgi:hypothetical protein